MHTYLYYFRLSLSHRRSLQGNLLLLRRLCKGSSVKDVRMVRRCRCLTYSQRTTSSRCRSICISHPCRATWRSSSVISADNTSLRRRPNATTAEYTDTRQLSPLTMPRMLRLAPLPYHQQEAALSTRILSCLSFATCLTGRSQPLLTTIKLTSIFFLAIFLVSIMSF